MRKLFRMISMKKAQKARRRARKHGTQNSASWRTKNLDLVYRMPVLRPPF